MEPHQQVRIKVVLGLEEDLTGAGYNVNQSKIAIGSGGLTGKGFLNGTQTKLKYVPEQDTDFIFCTVGEEQGFVGSAAVLIAFLVLIFRLIFLSERQPPPSVGFMAIQSSVIFLFHLFINIGMVLGLTPGHSVSHYLSLATEVLLYGALRYCCSFSYALMRDGVEDSNKLFIFRITFTAKVGEEAGE